MTIARLEEVEKLTWNIKKNDKNIALYKTRIEFYQDLMELNFDNNDWTIYADKFEADLSRLIELDGTPHNYSWRGSWFTERFRRFPPISKTAELYPRNRYFDNAASDYLKAAQLNSAPTNLISVYTNLGELYALRPQKLLPDANLQKWRAKFPFKLVLSDFDKAVKYRQKALEIGSKMPYADVLKSNLAGTYKISADTASRLGDYETALKLYREGQNYLSDEYSQCPHYAGWGEVYLKLNKFDKAIEIFNVYQKTGDVHCVDLLANRGDAFASKGESERALSDYNKALTLNEDDSLQRMGWVYIKRAKLFLRIGKTEQALNDLNTAAEKKYIAACPLVYRIRAEVYRKLGKKDLAAKDVETADNLTKQGNCPPD